MQTPPVAPRTAACLVAAWCLVSLTTVSFVVAGPPEKVDVLIQFHQPPGPNEHALVRGLGGSLKHSYDIVPAVAASLPPKAVAALLKNPNVSIVELDAKVQSTDAELDAVWGVRRVNSEFAHLLGHTGAGVKVAVIDSGIDYTHPDLAPLYAGGYDFVNGDSDPMDDKGHGTHCAGTVAAVDDDAGVIGVAPNVQLYALKVLDSNGSGSWSDILAAMDWCVKNKIQVTSNSYGASGNPGSVVENAYLNSYAAGILHIASAGNNGNSTGTGDSVGYPGNYSCVVAVGATNSSDVRASFSSTGPGVELAAPGANIRSTVPGGYANYNGTSMACPHVTGAAAVLLGVNPNLTNTEVRALLTASALDLGEGGKDAWYGHGLLDVAMALEMLASSSPEDPPAEQPPAEDPPAEEPPADPPAGPIMMTVASIDYYGAGGRKRDRNLVIEVLVVDEFGVAVQNAVVDLAAFVDGNLFDRGTATTGTDGVAKFNVRKAPQGTWNSVVKSVLADGFEWDTQFPINSYGK
jgi:subtilisin